MEDPGVQVPSRNADGTFPPGVSGNPSGRPKGAINARQRFRNHVTANLDRLDKVFDAHIAKCVEGDASALKLLYDTLDGLLAVKIEGLSEQDIQDRLTRLMIALRERLPAQYHAAITDAARVAMVGDGDEA